MYRTIARATTQVAHHVGALIFVKGVEVLSHDFLARFGTNVRNWPTAVLILLAVVLYLAGLATAKTISRRWLQGGALPFPEHPAQKPLATADVGHSTNEEPAGAAEPPVPARRKEPPARIALAALAVAAMLAVDRLVRR